jgi:hypothetical protein
VGKIKSHDITPLINTIVILVNKLRTRPIPAPVDDGPCVVSDTYPSDYGIDGLNMDNVRGRHLIVLDDRAFGKRSIAAVCLAFLDPSEYIWFPNVIPCT